VVNASSPRRKRIGREEKRREEKRREEKRANLIKEINSVH
jgi:hypothetical protein